MVCALSQNLRQLPERSRSALGANVVLDDSYDYDANGNVAAISDGLAGGPGDRDMSYDALDRLAGVVAGPAQGGNGSFAYDPLDNLRVLDQGCRQFRYHYDADNRLAQIKSPTGALLHSFGYDARGNTTSKDSGTLTFDRENRLTESRLPGYQSYVYDGLGRRVRERADATSTYFYYSHAGSLLRTADYKTSVNTDHIYLAGSLVAARKVPQGGGVAEVTYQHTDALGTPVAFTDAAGNVTRRERMTAWGEPADGTWSNEPGYTGHQMDAGSKLVYMQQRYYDPAIGRFLSVDPVTTDPNTGAMFNRYNYAANSPYVFVDPDGRRNGRVNPNPNFGSLTTDQKREVAKIVAKSHQMDISGENIEIAPGRGAQITANSLVLHEETFESRSELAAAIGHEIEVHLEVHINERGGDWGAPVDAQQHHLDEAEAFQYNVDNAQRFNNSASEVKHFEDARDGHIEAAEQVKKKDEQ